MIKALLLIVAPSSAWERIARSRRSVVYVLLLYLAPTIALSLFVELAGHNFLAARFSDEGARMVPHDLALQYALIQLGAGLLAAVITARLIKVLSETFHNRTTYTQCFCVTAYALGPFYLLHILDAVPVLSPWITFIVGIVFSFSTLYYAIPHVLKPDPPHAFGLFVMGGFLLTFVCLIARMGTLLAVPKLPLH